MVFNPKLIYIKYGSKVKEDVGRKRRREASLECKEQGKNLITYITVTNIIILKLLKTR
jgi:hypothetical protein